MATERSIQWPVGKINRIVNEYLKGSAKPWEEIEKEMNEPVELGLIELGRVDTNVSIQR